MRREILLSGTGWIGAGVVCMLVWSVEAGKMICSECPGALIPNSSISAHCQCSGPVGLLYTGVFVILVGAALFVLNRKIEGMMDRYGYDVPKHKRNRRG
jgi:hypothetical protein